MLNRSEKFDSIALGLEKSLSTSAQQIDIMIAQQTTMKEVLQNMENVVPNANEQVKKIITDLAAASELLNKQLENELNNSLSGLGQHLATLSNRFVQDYTPLTERLKDILLIAEKIKQ